MIASVTAAKGRNNRAILKSFSDLYIAAALVRSEKNMFCFKILWKQPAITKGKFFSKQLVFIVFLNIVRGDERKETHNLSGSCPKATPMSTKYMKRLLEENP